MESAAPYTVRHELYAPYTSFGTFVITRDTTCLPIMTMYRDCWFAAQHELHAFIVFSYSSLVMIYACTSWLCTVSVLYFHFFGVL